MKKTGISHRNAKLLKYEMPFHILSVVGSRVEMAHDRFMTIAPRMRLITRNEPESCLIVLLD
jgi:flagellar motor switch protein FliG